jgi:hypothetical protein
VQLRPEDIPGSGHYPQPGSGEHFSEELK